MLNSSSTTNQLDSPNTLPAESLPSQQPSFLPASAEDIQKILSFEDITAVVNFFESIGWTPLMELQLLIDIIQNSDNDNTRLRALKDLQARRKEIIENSGLVVKATKIQKNEDGGQTIFSTNLVSSALDANSNSNRSETNEQSKPKKEPKKPEFTETECEARRDRANTRPRDSKGRLLPSVQPDGGTIQNTDKSNRPDSTSRETDITNIPTGDSEGSTISIDTTDPGNASFHKPPTGKSILRGVTR